MSGKRFILTVNNYKGDYADFVTEDKAQQHGIKYAVWQHERGDKGTDHVQALLIYHKTQRFAGVKKQYPSAHVEAAKGTTGEGKAYCTKSDTRVEGPWEWGKYPNETGKRNDLQAVKEAIDGGASELQLADEHFGTYVRLYRGLREYKRFRATKRSFRTHLYILWGPPGTGKSRLAASLGGHDAYYNSCGKWWDGYDGQRVIIFDDFYGGIPWSQLLRLADRYPVTVETKGGVVEFTSTAIIITSNKDPRTWYDKDFAALERRVDMCLYMAMEELDCYVSIENNFAEQLNCYVSIENNFA